MREIVSKNGNKIVISPWLRIQDAADYCGVSRSAFEAHCDCLPHGGLDARTRLYHVDMLDRWIRGELDMPFVK